MGAVNYLRNRYAGVRPPLRHMQCRERRHYSMNWANLTERAQKAVWMAQESASSLGNDFLDTDHLLIGLAKLEEGIAYEAMVALSLIHISEPTRLGMISYAVFCLKKKKKKKKKTTKQI